MLKLITPLIIAIIVSAILAFILNDYIEFWKGFCGTLAIQFIIGAIINNRQKFIASIEMEKQLTQRIADAAKQTLRLRCPCTEVSEQTVPIRLDTPNFYKCIKCDKTISVNLQATTAQATDIIDIDATHSKVAAQLAEKEQI